jgi:hypothetical protein
MKPGNDCLVPKFCAGLHCLFISIQNKKTVYAKKTIAPKIMVQLCAVTIHAG